MRGRRFSGRALRPFDLVVALCLLVGCAGRPAAPTGQSATGAAPTPEPLVTGAPETALQLAATPAPSRTPLAPFAATPRPRPSPSRTRTEPEPSPPVPTATTMAAAQAESLLTRQDPVPVGIEEQLAFGGAGAGEICYLTEEQDPEPRVTFPLAGEEATVEIGRHLETCFYGFEPNEVIEIGILRPGGSVLQERIRVSENGIGYWAIPSLPGDPLGQHLLLASQGERRAIGIYTIEGASEPAIRAYPAGGPLGTNFQIGLVGLEPDQPVSLYLYRSRGEYLTYVTSGSFQADGRGEALVDLATRQDDPPGTYHVFADVADLDTSFQVSPSLYPPDEPSPATESVLQRQDVPPAGGSSVLVLSEIACAPRAEPVVYPDYGNDELTIGGSIAFCLAGFEPEQEIDLELVLPDGSARQDRIRARDDGIARWPWSSGPGDPLGAYTLTAGQGARTATTSFTLEAASGHYVATRPGTARAGETFTILFFGFPPNEPLPFHLYRCCVESPEESKPFTYATSLVVETDERGDALYQLPTLPHDPPGVYGLATDLGYVEEDFEVLPPTASAVRVEPDVGPAGTTFQIRLLTDFSPFEQVELSLYRREPDGSFTRIRPVILETGWFGGGSLYTREGDPPGTYVLSPGRPDEGAVFTVTAETP